MYFPNSTVLLEEGDTINATTFVSLPERTESSIALSDPIATHLLVETALGDSKSFDVLPFEELDSLKREDSLLMSRIHIVRRKLAIVTKVRNAAASLNRLNGSKGNSSSASSPISPQRSPSISKNDGLDHAETELAESTKKCEEMSQELYYLEQRSRQTQTKLLRHTAAILQLTYGNGHRPHMNGSGVPGGRPYSPDSLGNPDTDWDKMNDFTNRNRNFDGDARDMDGYLDDFNDDAPNSRISADTMKLREEQFAISKRLGELSNFIRDMMSQVNSEHAFAISKPPQLPDDPKKVEFAIFEQLNFIDRGLSELREEQNVRRLIEPLDKGSGSAQAGGRSLRAFDQTEANLLRQLLELNNKLIQVLHATNIQQSIPQVPSIRDGIGTQIKFARSVLSQITKAIKIMTLAAYRSEGKSLSNSGKLAQYTTVIDGLWQIILACEEDTQRRREQDRESHKSPLSDGDSDSGISLNDTDDGLPTEFSLSAFSLKVQWLVANSVYLKDRKSDMRQRMNLLHETVSQRNTNGSEAARGIQAQLDRANEDHSNVKADLSLVTSRLASSQAQLAELEQTHADLQQSHDDLKQSHTNLQESHADIQQTHSDLRETHSELKESHALLSRSRSDLEKSHLNAQRLATDTSAATTSLTRERDDARALHAQSTSELKSLEAELIRLKSELTIARAEADAAHGSRLERAAEVAKAADSEAVMREGKLRKELEATLAEFEELTRASVEAERERELKEGEVDRLRDIIESLEAQLSEERIGKLGMKSPGSDGGSASTSTSSGVLRSEFKKMMKDMRADHQKALRVRLTSTPILTE
jgi:Up-regulated During Septation